MKRLLLVFLLALASFTGAAIVASFAINGINNGTVVVKDGDSLHGEIVVNYGPPFANATLELYEVNRTANKSIGPRVLLCKGVLTEDNINIVSCGSTKVIGAIDYPNSKEFAVRLEVRTNGTKVFERYSLNDSSGLFVKLVGEDPSGKLPELTVKASQVTGFGRLDKRFTAPIECGALQSPAGVRLKASCLNQTLKVQARVEKPEVFYKEFAQFSLKVNGTEQKYRLVVEKDGFNPQVIHLQAAQGKKYSAAGLGGNYSNSQVLKCKPVGRSKDLVQADCGSGFISLKAVAIEKALLGKVAWLAVWNAGDGQKRLVPVVITGSDEKTEKAERQS